MRTANWLAVIAMTLGTVVGGAAWAADDDAQGGGDAASAYNFEVPQPAGGGCCNGYYDYENANGNAVQIMTNFNQKLAALQLALIEAMRLSTGQLSGNLREQTGAGHTLADQQDDRSVVNSVEQVRIDAIRNSTSGTTSCQVITGTIGGGIEGPTNRFKEELARALADHDRGSGDTPSSRGTSAALYGNVSMHCQDYADESDVAVGLCEKVGKLPGADVVVAKSLFSHGADGVSMTLDKDRLEASKAFILHSVTPQPAGPLQVGEGATPQGKEKAARRSAAFARNSIATETLADILARRTATPDNKITGWASGMAANMTGYEGMKLDEGLSKNDWLAIYSRGFLLQGDKQAQGDMDPVVAVKDIKNMMSVQLYQGFENYLLLERIAANLAIQTTILVEGTRGRTLTE